MTKGYKIVLIAFAILALAACNKDGLLPGEDVIVMKGVEKDPLVRLALDEVIPVSYPLTVLSTGKVADDVRVDIAIDNSLIEQYNKIHKTNYYTLPEADVKLDSSYVNIYHGKAASAVNNVTLLTDEHFEPGKTYVIPVTIKEISGNYKTVESERTIYIRIAQTIKLSSLDIDNADFSSNYIFTDEQARPMEKYTFEIKIYPYRWNGMTPNLSRLCTFCNKDEGQQLLFRFGEVVSEDVLQVMTPGATVVSNYTYPTNKWTMISVVYDGSAVSLYNDGVLDVSASTDASATLFQRMELGMSYQTYNKSQLFHGRISEIRIWERALSSSEMKTGLCGVAPESEGLVAYWKFDEEGGSVFKDVTGHGYDIDWSDTYRAVSGDDLVPQDKSAFVNRVKDDLNKCAN